MPTASRPQSVCQTTFFPAPQRCRSWPTTQAKQHISRCIRQDPRSILRQLAEPILHGSELPNTSTAHSICQKPLPQLWWVTDDHRASDTLYPGGPDPRPLPWGDTTQLAVTVCQFLGPALRHWQLPLPTLWNTALWGKPGALQEGQHP